VGLGLTGTAGARAAGFAPRVPRGGVLLPAGARDLGPVAPSTRLNAMVTLRPRRPQALAAYARAVTDPSSSDYHHYLSVAQFERHFAPAPAQLRAVRARLRARGLTVAATTANGLSIPVSATARVTADAFGTSIHRYVLPGGNTGEATTSRPRAGTVIQAVVGLDTVAPTADAIVRRGAHGGSGPVADATARSTAGPQPCAAARAVAAQNGSLTADEVGARYGMAGFWAAGDEGRGVTVALYELEPFDATDVASFQACMGTSAAVTTEAIDGGAGTGPGSGEAAMDVEDVIGLAPQASIRVYEGPQSGLGAYDTYSQIVSDDAAQVVSTSWGLCESQEGLLAAEAENTLFQEAAVQGQSVVAASGDMGADDCGDGQRSVDDPAAQPWVTAVGGTSIAGSQDTVWDDGFGASGGGTSQLWAQPSWQTGAAQPQSALTCAVAACREVPDLSVDGDPTTGYAAYFQGAWQTVGGTSVSAPTVASLAALADASPACGGQSLGFLDPALYAAAGSAGFADVTVGTNSFDGVGGFAAGAGYDMASGLGTPTAALGPALCHDAVSLAAPASQSWMTGRPVALALSATSAQRAAITWSDTGLPAGLALDPATGRITGTPTAAGRSTVTVTAVDAGGATASAAFTVTVARGTTTVVRQGAGTAAGTTGRGSAASGAPPVFVGRLRGLTGRVGQAVRLKLRARDAGGLAVRFAAAGLPRGLRIDRRTGVIAGTLRARGRSTVTVKAGDRTGKAARSSFRWTVNARRAPATHRHHRAKRHGKKVQSGGRAGQAAHHQRR
jgi:hypothetical protein